MPSTTTSISSAANVSPEMARLLRAGVSDGIGIICRPGQVRKFWPILREAERLGYLRFLDIERPWITDEGRAAIGAPSQVDADYARLVLLCRGARKPLVPAKRDDPRTDFDYRSYSAAGYVCILAVKAPDDRLQPHTIKIIVPNSSRTQGLGGDNSIIQPESEGRFVVAVVPDWLQKLTGLPTYAMPLSEDEYWTDPERATWDRLRSVCISINSRIRNSNRAAPERRRFGENA